MRPTKLTGCEPHQGVKAARKVALIRKAQIQRDGGQWLLGALDQLGGLPDPLLEHVAMRWHAYAGLECPEEVVAG